MQSESLVQVSAVDVEPPVELAPPLDAEPLEPPVAPPDDEVPVSTLPPQLNMATENATGYQHQSMMFLATKLRSRSSRTNRTHFTPSGTLVRKVTLAVLRRGRAVGLRVDAAGLWWAEVLPHGPPWAAAPARVLQNRPSLR